VKRQFKSYHGKYLSVQADGSLQWNRASPSRWETFDVEHLQDDLHFIKSWQGRYLTVDSSGNASATSAGAGQNEVWGIESLDGSNSLCALRSPQGKYVSVQPDGTMTVDADDPGDWETLTSTFVF
jgi:hypothetical protein